MTVQYYQDLLIKQYREKPKARGIIKALYEAFPLDALQQMNDAYKLEDAFGKQLTVLARWVGANRNYPSPRFASSKFFAMPLIDGNTIETTDVTQTGFQEFNNPQPQDGPFLFIEDLSYNDNLLDDDTLRILVELKIIQNHARATQKNIDDALYKVFGMDIYTTWPDTKVLQYNCTPLYTTALIVGRENGWLPKPTDCRILINEI